MRDVAFCFFAWLLATQIFNRNSIGIVFVAEIMVMVACKREAVRFMSFAKLRSACGWIGNDLRPVWRWRCSIIMDEKGGKEKKRLSNTIRRRKEFVDIHGTMTWIWWYTISLAPNCRAFSLSHLDSSLTCSPSDRGWCLITRDNRKLVD